MRIAPRDSEATALPDPYVVPPSQKFDGNDGQWSTFRISVGTPGQDFRVLASTKSGETYVVTPEGCQESLGDPSDCPELRGADVFGSSQSPGFQVDKSSTWSTIGQYDVTLEDALNYTGQGVFGYDTIALGPAADSSSLSMGRQIVGGIADPSYFMGHIPLGVPDSSFSSLSKSIDSFMYQMRNSSKIPSLSFGYTAGAKYRLKSVFGNLVLGGYDSTRFKQNDEDFTYSFSSDPSRLLTVGVESVMAMNTLKGTYSLSSDSHFSLIDSTVPHLWLPLEICDNFEDAFGLTYDPQTDLYLVNDTIHEQLKEKNPSITIKLVNSVEDTSTNYTNIVLPYAAFDLQASYPHYQNATNYFPIRRAANDSQYTLGRTFLQEAYLIVDYERGNFSVSQAVFPDPLPASKIITITSGRAAPPESDDSKSLSTGAIAGIAVGGAAIVILIIACLFFFRRKRKTSKKYELANNQVSENGSHAALAGAASQKVHHEPQELGGTPLTELASPRHPSDHKPHLSPTNIPQELPTPRETPRWQEVTNFYEMDGGSAQTSRSHSRPTSEITQPNSARNSSNPSFGVSPLTQTPRYQFQNRYD